MIKICENCGKEFNTEKMHQRFCSRKCKQASSKRRMRKGERRDNIRYTKICPICGAEFTTSCIDKIYCSDKCIYKSRKEYNIQYRKKYYEKNKDYFKEYSKQYLKNNKYKYTCLTCGKLFESNNRYLKNSYCNNCISNNNFKHICEQCGSEFFSTSKTSRLCDKCIKKNKKTLVNKNKKRYNKVCVVCGKSFFTSKSIVKFCSDECRRVFKNIKGKEYRNNPLTRVRYKASQTKWRKKTYKNNPEYKLKKFIYLGIYNKLKYRKKFHTLDYIGYSISDLKRHIESQFQPDMNWDNHGLLWHIDHIKPCSSFKFINEDDSVNYEAIKECWSLTNLQPLYKEENLKKSSWYEGSYYRGGEKI